MKRGDEIEHSGITRMREFLTTKLCKVQKAKNVEAMINGYDHDITTAGQVSSGGTRRVRRSHTRTHRRETTP